MDYAAGEYLDAMEEAELLDPEDLSDLKMSSRSVKEMDSFRFFFVSAFVLPAYREVARDAGKRIKAEMSDLGLPEEIHQTLLNQVTGSARKKPEQIKKKQSGTKYTSTFSSHLCFIIRKLYVRQSYSKNV